MYSLRPRIIHRTVRYYCAALRIEAHHLMDDRVKCGPSLRKPDKSCCRDPHSPLLQNHSPAVDSGRHSKLRYPAQFPAVAVIPPKARARAHQACQHGCDIPLEVGALQIDHRVRKQNSIDEGTLRQNRPFIEQIADGGIDHRQARSRYTRNTAKSSGEIDPAVIGGHVGDKRIDPWIPGQKLPAHSIDRSHRASRNTIDRIEDPPGVDNTVVIDYLLDIVAADTRRPWQQLACAQVECTEVRTRLAGSTVEQAADIEHRIVARECVDAHHRLGCRVGTVRGKIKCRAGEAGIP